jgi:hypothetical protein
MRNERWTIKSPLSGEILAQFIVEAEPVTDAVPATTPPAGPVRSVRGAPSASRPGQRPDTGEKMTDPQKRYLFRLLAAQSVNGKAAEAHLKEYFRVERLADIPKAAASTYIDQLAKDRADVGA